MPKENEKQTLQDHEAGFTNARSEALRIIKQANQNGVKIGATVTQLDKVDGKIIFDKATQSPAVDNNGEVKRYADKFYVTLEFNGGTLKTEIKKEAYETLEIGARYSCGGRIAPVNVFGDIHLLPVFDSFVFLYGNDDF